MSTTARFNQTMIRSVFHQNTSKRSEDKRSVEIAVYLLSFNGFDREGYIVEDFGTKDGMIEIQPGLRHLWSLRIVLLLEWDSPVHLLYASLA